jgi:glycosyltransferase involved in cell wall biosynthesis
MHVVFLGHVARFSGAEIELLRFVQTATDVQRTVLLAEDGPMVQALRDAGATVEIMELPERARGLKRTEMQAGARQAGAAVDIARYIVQLRSRLRQLQPDAVGAISLKAGAYGVLAARAARLPFVWHLHDQISSSYLNAAAVRPMRTLIATLPNAVITPSRTTLDTVGWIRPGIRQDVVPHPIPRPPRAMELRAEVKRIGIVGRIAPWKGQDVFLRAFARAVPDPDVHAVIVGSAIFGEADYGDALQTLADDLGIADRVEFTGFRADVPAEFQKLDLLVHASVLTEPFGTVVFEAMAAGLPVIAARSGGVAEYIDHGRHGLLHEPGSVEDLGRMLRTAIDDAELRRSLAAAGRELTAAFAPERIAARWIEIYGHVIRQRSPA